MELEIRLSLPAWIADEVGDPGRAYPTIESRMELALRLAGRNVAEGTGGPFGAGVFDRETGRLIAPGVNVVVPSTCSVAHAEIMAIAGAQQARGVFDLGSPAGTATELISSAEPCIQCFGAIWWSGVTRVVTGARRQDVETISGFSEGPLPEDWPKLLARRPPLPAVEVLRDCLRSRAADVLRRYRDGGGRIYNPGAG